MIEPTIAETMVDPQLCGATFGAESWRTWRALLAVAFGHAELLGPEDRAAVQALVGDRPLPPERVKELWIVAGRRSGKSIAAALIGICLGAFGRYALAPGETPVVMVLAADRAQAGVILNYIKGLLRDSPLLAPLVVEELAESIMLSTGVSIEVHTSSYRAVRGRTLVAALLDETAFWSIEAGAANPDREVLAAVRPALASVPGSMLVSISTAYARRGTLWSMYERHYGQPGDVLVVQAMTRQLNPTIDQAMITRALDEDEAAAAAEWCARFRSDVESFLPLDAITAVVVPERRELPPLSDVRYVAFIDPAGGSGSDSMTLAIAHRSGDRVVLDAVRERHPPFSPESIVGEFAELCRAYRITSLTGDRWGGEWCRQPFEKMGIRYRVSDRVKSDIYVAALPLINSGLVDLLDVPKLKAQLAGLERRTARGGHDSVDHAPRGHDDVANAVCGALTLARKRERPPLEFLPIGPRPPLDPEVTSAFVERVFRPRW